ncbi:MAG: DUF1801 domain-containing protein [Parafilimonas sp.]|nr:DUF1801 domain-containing protein [Parafilimonas sp.]
MAEIKTKQTDKNVVKFLDTISDETKRKDSFEIIELMQEVTGLPPKMWGTSIIGFGSYHYKYESGHEGDMCIIGFSPRKNNIAIYGMGGEERNKDLLAALGKHKTGKGCLYINKLSDVNADVLKNIFKASFEYLNKKYNG